MNDDDDDLDRRTLRALFAQMKPLHPDRICATRRALDALLQDCWDVARSRMYDRWEWIAARLDELEGKEAQRDA